jgi:TRAP-type C4-dicarboxylate transport system substrate-binding protein
MQRFYSIALLGSIAASAMLVVAPAAQAAKEFKVVTGLARNHDQIEIFFDHFLKPINADKASPFKLKYLGSTEITPRKQLGPAIKRGLFDVLMSPSSYYAGYVAEGRYAAIANQGHKALRANGAYDALQEAWAKGINARIIAWPYWKGTTFHIYLTNKPKLSKKTGITLVGQKMRAVSLYIPLLKAMGATPVVISPSEVFTALQRGVVTGLAWPEGAITKYGWQKYIKAKISTGFWRSSTMMVMNLDKYKALTKKERVYLEAAALKLEDESGAAQRKIIDIDNKKVFAEGVKLVNLDAAHEKAYLNTIFGATWDAAKTDKKLVVPYAKLRKLLYKE